MNNHFTITINDDHGVRQFNLHQFAKKAILYIIVFITLIALMAIGSILYLDNAVDEIEAKRIKVEQNYSKLTLKNDQLYKNIQDAQDAIDSKKNELAEVSESLTEIEELIGLSKVEDMPLQERIDITKLNSENMATIFQFVPNGSPILYKGITSKYGSRTHPTLKRKEFHRGSDMKAKMNTPVYATADAIIEYAGNHKKSGYGKLVILQHNYGFRTLFGHLNKIVVKSGRYVKKGDLIAYTGNTGMSSGPHLHYEIKFLARAVNPYWFIKWNVANYKDIFQKEKKIPWQSLITTIAQIKVSSPTQTLLSLRQDQQSKGK